MKIVAIRQLVSRDMLGLLMSLVGCGSNDNRLQVGKRMEWMVCLSAHKHLDLKLLGYTDFLRLKIRNLVIVSTVDRDHALISKERL